MSSRLPRLAFAAIAIAAIAWTAWLRWPGLDPKTLWADDVWVASLTKLPLADAVTAPAPVPPLFVAALKGTRLFSNDLEIPLQVLPFLAGLAGAGLAGLLAARLTGSRDIGLVALALALASPFLAHYSIFVKQYSLDFAVTAGLLLAGVALFRREGAGLAWVAAAGVGAAVISIPSVFTSVPIVHLAALVRGWRAPAAVRWRVAAAVAAFDLALLAIFGLWLADRSNPTLTAFWRADFLPAASLAEAWAFLTTNGYTALCDALPDELNLLTPLSAVGLVALLVRRDTRLIGLTLLGVFGALLVASALGRYPIGTDFRGRTVIFSYAITIVLVATGAHAILRWIPGCRFLFAAAAAAALMWLVVHPLRVEYFPLNHVDLVRELQSQAGSRDALVLNGSGAYLAGYYAPWDIEAVPDDSPQAFGVRVRRPLTITLPRGSEEGRAPLTLLDDLLKTERPERAFYFATRRGFEAVEAAFAAHGYKEVHRTTSTVSTVLILYARTGS